MRRLEFFYDFVCPYAYLASRRIEATAERAGVDLEYVPILLGGVFRAIGSPDIPMNAVSTAKAAYMERQLVRSAEREHVTLVRPANHPRRTVLALRSAIASGDVPRASRALFAAYWEEGRDLEDGATVKEALDRAGLDGARAVREAEEGSAKDALFANTDRALKRGVFGVPSFGVLDDDRADLYWGQDRLTFVERALRIDAGPAPSTLAAAEPERAHTSVEMFFDYSSPFAYLASTQVDAIRKRAGVEVVLRPLLLGGLFREIGTPDVPLFAMPEPKRRYQLLELERWATHYDVAFRMPSRFPMNTVKALRLTLLCPEERKSALIAALFRALWAEDRDISNDDELRSIARDAGVEIEELWPRVSAPDVKVALRTATDVAKERGVFGVPTFVVGDELFFGQDQIEAVVGEVLGTADSSS